MSEDPGFDEISDSPSTWERYKQAQRAPVSLMAAFVLGILILLTANLVNRQLPTNFEWIWVPALAQVMVIWIVFVPIGYLQIDESHIRIEFFYDQLPESVQQVVDYVAIVVSIVVVAAFLVSAVKTNLLFGQRVSPRGIPTYAIYGPVALGMAVLIMEYFRQFGARLRRDLW